jgi:alpha-L-rhamnosidase
MINKGIEAKELRCEYLVNPLGIDDRQPRLSWILESGQRGQRQTGYQILVASSEELLERDQGDLWDSGQIPSDQTSQVCYSGKPLLSRMRCCWKVRAWDKDGKVSDWSTPAYWTVGLLESEDWQARWIGLEAEPEAEYTKPVEPVDLTGCTWIWHGGERIEKAGPGTWYFLRTIVVPQDRTIKRARIRLSANDRFVLFINEHFAGTTQTSELSPGWHGPVYNFECTGMIQPGENALAVQVANDGKGAITAGLLGRVMIEFASGEPELSTIDSGWKVSRRPGEGWKRLGFDDSRWDHAQEIASLGDLPWGRVDHKDLKLPPSSFLRKEFRAEKKAERAMVYISALGCYELHLNGQRVGPDYFAPGWTDYNKRVYYRTYDVTNLLKKRDNAIGAILGDGWYAGYIGWSWRREFYGRRPWLKAQLELEYADGSRELVVTDASWKGHYGAILESDLQMGETYDARLESADWDRGGYDDSKWTTVAVKEHAGVPLQSYPGVTVQITGEVKAVAVQEPTPGKYVFDLGQNIGGWARLKATGQSGDRVVLRFAELVRTDGMIHTENLRGARCQDTYILKGGEEEIWQPRFTFRGFRYVEVTGFPGKPSLDAITGIVAHSATPLVGTYECSRPMVNQLSKNIVWTRRANVVEVPTDCPQRNERLGWTGDAGINIRAMTYNMDVAAFFTKWLVDVDDAQNNEGAYSDNAPNPSDPRAGTSGWGDGAVISSWTMYSVYGDTRIIEDHYEGMARWIEYLKRHSANLLRPAEGYGDWLSFADTPKDVFATAYFAYSARLLSRMAEAIGRKEDAGTYKDLFQQIKEAFNNAYVSEDGKIKGGTQTCYVLGLYFDLLPEEKLLMAGEHLIAAIEQRNWHVSTGIVGTGLLLPTLTKIGRTDVAYRLLNNDTFPSWGHMIKNGATTIWESWDSWTEEKGFQDHSFNQPALGAVGEWLFATCAGIQTDGPGFKRLVISPEPGVGMNYVRASYNSIHGRITTEWKTDGANLKLEVTIPANTTATVSLPAQSEHDVTESRKPAAQSEGVKLQRIENNSVVLEIGSGSYQFISRKNKCAIEKTRQQRET